MKSGEIHPLDMESGESMEVSPGLEDYDYKTGHDYFLKVKFSIPADEVWAKKGHVVAWEQFAVPFTSIRNWITTML